MLLCVPVDTGEGVIGSTILPLDDDDDDAAGFLRFPLSFLLVSSCEVLTVIVA